MNGLGECGAPGVASVVWFPMTSLKNNPDVLPEEDHSSGTAGFFRNLAIAFPRFSGSFSSTQAAPRLTSAVPRPLHTNFCLVLASGEGGDSLRFLHWRPPCLVNACLSQSAAPQFPSPSAMGPRYSLTYSRALACP